MLSKLSLRHKSYFIVAALSLVLGFASYILFQPNIFLLDLLGSSHHRIVPDDSDLQKFLSGQLADIAWCISLYICTIVLSEKFDLRRIDKLALLFLPFLTEFLQKVKLIPGTFDWYDIICYLIILIIIYRLFPHLIFKKL